MSEHREHGGTERSLNPVRAVPKKFLEPILYLADRMTAADGNVTPPERRMINELADAVGLQNFRTTPTFSQMNVEDACKQLDLQAAKKAALVVIALVLKSDFERHEGEHEYFHRVRKLLGAEPITVPVNLEEHKELALEFLRGS